MTTWWESPRWLAYEAAYGDAPGTRATLLRRANWRTQVVALTPAEKDLWRDVRRSYRSLIHAADRRYQRPGGLVGDPRGIAVYVGPGAGALIRTCQRVHVLAAGRRTRPDQTWDLMGDWADDGAGLMALALDYEHPPDGMEDWPPCAGFAYFVIHGRWSYYFSGATLRDCVSHALIWRGLLALKAVGVHWCELGWLERDGDSEKDRGISHFKTGFGGAAISPWEAAQLCGR